MGPQICGGIQSRRKGPGSTFADTRHWSTQHNPGGFKPEAVSDPSQAKARGGDIAWGAQLATDLHPTPHTHGRPLRWCEVRVVQVICMGKRKRVARSVGTWMDSADLRTEKEQRKQWREWQWRMCKT